MYAHYQLEVDNLRFQEEAQTIEIMLEAEKDQDSTEVKFEPVHLEFKGVEEEGSRYLKALQPQWANYTYSVVDSNGRVYEAPWWLIGAQTGESITLSTPLEFFTGPYLSSNSTIIRVQSTYTSEEASLSAFSDVRLSFHQVLPCDRNSLTLKDESTFELPLEVWYNQKTLTLDLDGLFKQASVEVGGESINCNEQGGRKFELFDNRYDDGSPYSFIALYSTEGKNELLVKCDYLSNVGSYSVGLRAFSSNAVSQTIQEYTLDVNVFESCFKDELEARHNSGLREGDLAGNLTSTGRSALSQLNAQLDFVQLQMELLNEKRTNAPLELERQVENRLVVEFLSAFLIFITLVLSCLFGCVVLNKENSEEAIAKKEQSLNRTALAPLGDGNLSHSMGLE